MPYRLQPHRARLSARAATSCGRLRDAVRQVAARVPDRPARSIREAPRALAQLRGGLRRGRAGAALARAIAPTCCRSTSCRSTASTSSCRRWREILRRHRVNVLNVSIRHALPDPGSLLAWAREEIFAFVLYYKQRTRRERARAGGRLDARADRRRARVRRLVLPALPAARHAEQFHRAYPRAQELFALKRRLDPRVPAPQRALGQVLRADDAAGRRRRRPATTGSPSSTRVYSRDKWHGRVLSLPAERLPPLPGGPLPHAHQGGLRSSTRATRRSIASCRRVCPTIKPFLADSPTRCRRSRSRSARWRARRLELLGDRRDIDGYRRDRHAPAAT